MKCIRKYVSPVLIVFGAIFGLISAALWSLSATYPNITSQMNSLAAYMAIASASCTYIYLFFSLSEQDNCNITKEDLVLINKKISLLSSYIKDKRNNQHDELTKLDELIKQLNN